MIKKARVYNLIEAPEITLQDLEDAMDEHRARDLEGPQAKGLGWTSPAGRGSEALTVEIQAQRLLCVMKQKRLLPDSVIKDELEERKEALETRQGSKLPKKEITALKEEITEELLPRAFVKKTSTMVWWDTRRNRIVIEASSGAEAEDVLNLLRETLGSLKVVPLATKNLPVRVMTEWLKDPSSRPAWLSLGTDVTLKATDEDVTYTIKKGELDGGEGDAIEAMLEKGCTVEKLMLDVEGEASFEVDAQLTLKKVQLSDRIVEEMNNVEDDDPLGRLQTEFIITADTLSNIIGMLSESMGGATVEQDENLDEEDAA